ncbi:hypothetical protein KI387_034128 [Taxus chinensis]|uniref:Uncharacterized protein n=1 Tax=Taxus chinensis TaxID=29808 RepID=A0AA38BZE6_TAXCH|nr:hypothetical protein KI387_034128 [Taxus chinensis]
MSIATPVKVFLVLALAIAIHDAKADSGDARKPYIVHMLRSMKPQHFSLHEHWYASLLDGVTSHSDPSLLLYKYDIILHGFAAKLTRAEAEALESFDGCLAVIPSSLAKIHTTHSPEFLGLARGSDGGVGLWSQYSNYGEDVIVGVVDTGIWPESASFHDGGLGPVPSRWKGECENGEDFNSSKCNRKLIGARFNFSQGYKLHMGKEYMSPRDISGHGTHTASTASGSAVSGANFHGFGTGTAVGMAPSARLAVYKACWGAGTRCDLSDVAAAMEKAIEDGVDILSLSIGSDDDNPFYKDHQALAAFGAIQKGVFVSASAGNSGPSQSSVTNTAPWITTVGASNIDRAFLSPVTLGDGNLLKGSSFYRGNGIQNLGLINASCTDTLGLDASILKGKIVLCDSNDSLINPLDIASRVKKGGGEGMILVNQASEGAEDLPIQPQSYLPATRVSFFSGNKIKAYIHSTAKPRASINPTGVTLVGKSLTAPIVAAFSSRGPSTAFPDILKPDVIAPGVNILAAWTDGTYKTDSGTSMSCPHVSGIAALIRAAHPTWTPAAIKSALMTSSSILDNRNRPIKDAVTLKAADPFVMGAGHVLP